MKNLVMPLFVAAMLALLSPMRMWASQSAVSDLMAGADTVVVARVESVSPVWQENSHGDRLIVSRVLLRVEETMKGAPASIQWIELPGGTLDGLTLHVSSLPSLAAGERAVFFLEPQGSQGLRSPRRNGQGILKLDANDRIPGSAVQLDDLRAAARAGEK